MHRITVWRDDNGNAIQAAVSCLDGSWEPHVEVCDRLGPFDDLDEVLARLTDGCHNLGGWRAHQLELLD